MPFPWRPAPTPSPAPPVPLSSPPPVPSSPPGISLIYSTLVTKLDILDRTINSLDAKAGVLIGATAAAFGLVVTSVGGTTSLFLRYGALRGLALLVLAVAFFLLLSTVLVQDIRDTPDPKAFVTLANLSEERIKELSLDALVSTYEFNRHVLDQKSTRLFRGQIALSVFVGLVVVFELIDLGFKAATFFG